MNDKATLYQRGIVSLNAGNFIDAERSFRSVLEEQPEHIGALNLLTVILMTLGRYGEAEEFIRTATAINKSSDVSFYNYGIILKTLGRPREALEKFNFAIRLNPDLNETWNNRGTVFNDLREYHSAISDFDRAIALNQNYADAYANKGKSLSLLKCHDEAFAAFDKALALKPDLAEAWLGRGNVSAGLERYDEAFAAFNKALALKPDLAEAWLGRGNIFVGLKRYDEASAAFDKALALKPDLAEAWLGRGNVSVGLERYDEAFPAFDKSLALQPDANIAEGARLHCKMQLCNWSNFAAEREHLISSVNDRKLNTDPFSFLSISTLPEEQINCAKLWVGKMYPPADRPFWQGAIYKHDRIRVAYISSDFRTHSVSHLIAGLIEGHNKARFDTIGISLQPEESSGTGQRIKHAFGSFVDVSKMTDQKIAQLIHGREIDIAIDLNGFTRHARTNIFAGRPAPIQVNYLGYPGTMGAPYIDYIIADQIVVPTHQQDFYSEKIVYMPNSFQANDRERSISDKIFTRTELGLPPNGFVFCCFNTSYKINPDVFGIWMRILNQVSDSVLWLVADNKIAENNLRREAAANNISGDRLIFAPRIQYAEHLARLPSADLFLDTAPFNAGTTASDALWAKLPVLTRLCDGFSGRMAASLLTAIGLSELITSTRQEYTELAIALATNPKQIAALKHRLSQNLLTKPLFNTQLFARHVEQAYEAMYERYQSGLPPENIYVPQ